MEMIRFGVKREAEFPGGDGDRPCMMYSGLPTHLSKGLRPTLRGVA